MYPLKDMRYIHFSLVVQLRVQKIDFLFVADRETFLAIDWMSDIYRLQYIESEVQGFGKVLVVG